jgi:hypothetical protein
VNAAIPFVYPCVSRLSLPRLSLVIAKEIIGYTAFHTIATLGSNYYGGSNYYENQTNTTMLTNRPELSLFFSVFFPLIWFRPLYDISMKKQDSPSQKMF